MEGLGLRYKFQSIFSKITTIIPKTYKLRHKNMSKFYSFLVLVLFLGISAEFTDIKQKTERELAYKGHRLYNFGVTSEKSYTLAAHREKYSLNSSTICNKRSVRSIEPVEATEYSLQCYDCDSSSGNGEENSCYDGNIPFTSSCDASAQCYIDLKPQYIKRGCIVPNQRNRTFYCRCPLCNNKPTKEYSYFSRDTRDWEFDNYRLLTAEVADPFPCATCKTKGLNTTADDLCRIGEGVEKTVCGSHSACYTNINHETSEVSRGCISLPAYNSIYFLCNKSLCNGGSYKSSSIDRQNEHPILRRLLRGQQPCQQVQVIFDEGFGKTTRNMASTFLLTTLSVIIPFVQLFYDSCLLDME